MYPVTEWVTTKTIIHHHDPDTIPCPRCGGRGNLGDGSGSWSIKILPNGDHEITETHCTPTPCPVCKGKGRLRILPLEEYK